MTLQRCLVSIIVIWFISCSLSIILGLYSATLFFPDSASISCSFRTCQWPLSVLMVILLMIAYFTVILSYFAMVMRIRWNNVEVEDESIEGCQRFKTTKRNIKTMNRLGLNLLVFRSVKYINIQPIFSISKIPLVFVGIVALDNLSNLHELGHDNQIEESCKIFYYARRFYDIEVLSSIAAIIWLSGKCFKKL